MLQCCPLGGLRYLDDDGSVDWQELEYRADELAREMMDGGFESRADEVLEAAKNPCTCPCHKKNNPAIH